MDVIFFTIHLNESGLKIITHILKDFFKLQKNLFSEDAPSIFCYEDQMYMHLKNTCSAGSKYNIQV